MRSYFLLPEKRIVWSACIMLNKCLSGHWLVCRWRPFPPKFPTRVLAVKLESTSEGGHASKEGPQSPCGKFPGRMFSAWAPYGAAGSGQTGDPSFRSVHATGPDLPGAASPGPPHLRNRKGCSLTPRPWAVMTRYWRRKQNRLRLESRTPSWSRVWTLSSMPSFYGNDIPTGKPRKSPRAHT